MSQPPNSAHRIPKKTPLLLQQEREQAQQKKHVQIAAAAGAICGLAVVGALALYLFSAQPQVAGAVGPEPPIPAPAPPAEVPEAIADEETPVPAAEPAPAPEAPPTTNVEPAAPEPVAAADSPAASLKSEWSLLDVDPRIVALKFPQRVWLSAYDVSSGRLAISDDANSRIAFYDIEALRAGNAEPVAAIDTAGPPSAIVYKNFKDRRLLLVAGKDAPQIALLDADSLQPIGEVAVDRRCYVSSLLASADAEDPYVFYAVGRLPGEGRSGRSEELKPGGRVDLRTLQQDAAFRLFYDDSVRDGALSADGELLYYRSPSSRAGSSVVRWRNAQYDSPRAGRLSERGDVGTYVLDPYGNVVYESTRIHARDMIGDAYHTLEYEPKAQFVRQPVLVGVKYNELVFASANDYREVCSVALPEDWFPHRDPRARDNQKLLTDFRRRPGIALNDPGFLNVFADDDRGLAILTLMDYLVIVPLAALNLPQEPNLRPTDGVSLDQYVGEESLLPLKAAPGVKFEVVKFTGKSTPRIEGNRLRWTPDAQDVGRQLLRLRATNGALAHEWEWPFHVSYRPIEVPFDVDGLSMEPMDRVRAVVWGHLNVPTPADSSLRRHFIGVVDFERRKLLAHRELDRQVSTAVMSSRHVFMAPGDATHQATGSSTAAQLVKLALPSLEAEDQIVCNVDYTGFHLIADQYLAVGDVGSNRFSIPDLKPLPTLHLDHSDKLLYRRTGKGWVWDSVLYDEKFANPQLILPPPGPEDYHSFRSWPEWSPATYDFLGALAFNSQGQIEMEPPLKRMMTVQDQERKPQTLLQVRYLPPISDSSLRDGGGQRLAWGDDFLATLYGGEIYRIPFADFGVPPRQSLQFSFKQSAILLDMTRSTRVEYEAPGADRFRLSLMRNRSMPAYFEDESRNGKFTIPAFDESQQRMLVSDAVGVLKRFEYDGHQKRDSSYMLQAYLQEAAARYSRVLGKKPSGVIVGVPATATAETDAGESTSMSHLYLVEVPVRALRESLRQFDAQIR